MRDGPPLHRVMDAADRAEARAARGKGAPAPEAIPLAGRGRLSTVDLAAEHAPADVAWAIGELNASRRTQDDIRMELNDRLAVHGVEPISRTSFNRRALKQARLMRRLAAGREMYTSVVAGLTPGEIDEHNLAIGEILKNLCLELGQGDEVEIGTKGAMELARAYLAVIQAQKISADRRMKLEAGFKKDAATVIDAVAQEKGLTGDTVRGIKERILGLKLPKPEAA